MCIPLIQVTQSWFSLEKHREGWVTYLYHILWNATPIQACPSFLWNMQSIISLCLARNFEESSINTSFSTWPLCLYVQLVVFMCFHAERTNIIATCLKRLSLEEDKRQTKNRRKKSYWRVQRVQTCVNSEHLVPNQRDRCSPETSFNLSCHGQHPRITAKT